MSLRTVSAAFAIALTMPLEAMAAPPGVPTVPAVSNCDKMYNVGFIADQLFDMPAAQWPKAKIAAFGPRIVDELRRRAQMQLPVELERDATSRLREIENYRKKDTEPDWANIMKHSHKMFHPLYEQVKDKKMTVEDARTKAPVIASRYVLSAVEALGKVPTNVPQFCLAS